MDRVKKICPAAAIQTLGLVRALRSGDQRKRSPSHTLPSMRPRVSTRTERIRQKSSSRGMAILARVSIPRLIPRNSTQTLSARVMARKVTAVPTPGK